MVIVAAVVLPIMIVFFVVLVLFPRFLPVGVSLLAACFGMFFVYSGIYLWRRERREIAAFESTEGTILTSKVRGRDKKRSTKSVRVEYEYVVDGRTYVNDKLWPGAPTKKRQRGDWAYRFVDRYPEGSQVEIHYDPDDPSESFLEERRHRGTHALMVLMGLVTLLSVVVVTLLSVVVGTALLLAPA